MPAAEDFAQYKLHFIDYSQHDYEVIRPIVLWAETIAERSRQTGSARTVVGDKARRCVIEGMLGLVDQRPGRAGRKGQRSPDAVAAYLLYVKQLYPPIHDRERVRMVQRKFGYKTNHHTVKAFLARHASPVPLAWAMPAFGEFAEAYQARWTVVRLWYEGWQKQSIAGCLKLSRTHVQTILDAFQRDGFAGLEDQRTRPPDHPANQLSLPFLQEVLALQREQPRAGRFRVRGLLEARPNEPLPSEATVGRAMAINRQFHGAPGPGVSTRDEAEAATPPRHLPYRPQYRHEMWCVDIRYLVKREGNWVQSLCLLAGYSRTILAGLASAPQDRTAVLQLLFAALAEYGGPEMIISDHGAVFRAEDSRRLLGAWESAPKYIELRKPWQNLLEAQFKGQLRLADCKFAQAQTLAEIQMLQAAFIERFHTTQPWAHQEREDGRHTPVEGLEWVRGRPVDRPTLRPLFGAGHLQRTVNRSGFVSGQRFSIYAEPGRARQRVAIWLYEDQLRVEYQEALLARYRWAYNQRQRR